jgi:hypothetical protein
MTKQTPIHPSPPRDVYYSIGTHPTGNLKDRIAALHGPDSLGARAVPELDRFLTDPAFRQTRWYRAFRRKVLTGMSILYPHASAADQFHMAQEYIGDLVHSGYLRVLQSLATPGGVKHVSSAQAYAGSCGVSLSEALLFGPRGAAATELLHFIAAEKAHGIHRPASHHIPRLSAPTQRHWQSVGKVCNGSSVADDDREQAPLDLSEQRSVRFAAVTGKLQSLWRRNPALRDYTGYQRLSGETPYGIIEDAVDVLIENDGSPLRPAEKARYIEVVEEANQRGVDPFYAAYKALSADTLAPCWNLARQWLYDYSLRLWEAQNELWLAQGRRFAGGGVVYRASQTPAPAPKTQAVPGTIYRNKDRYWWVVKNKMKPRPLIDPQSKKKVPGTIFQDDGRYYWVISGVLGRQRLVPEGEQFSTQDRATAERIAYRKWRQLQKKDPSLAAYILSRRQAQGLATKDRILAEKIAAQLWQQIQQDEPELAARIQTNTRRTAKDGWYAQLVVEGHAQCIGPYPSKAQARAAYTREFEKAFGHPAGYNLRCKPKLERVWPSWQEQTARLDRMAEQPRLPVIGQTDEAEPLAPILQKMQQVDWLVHHVLVVFDDNSPVAWPEVAVQSRGMAWYEQARGQGRHLVICGCAYMDPESGRIRITLYRPGFQNRQVLFEEIYHIGLKVLFYAHPHLFTAIGRWHQSQLACGDDPTLSLADRFASMMAAEETGVRTTLPAQIVSSARKLLCPASRVPDSIMHQVIAHWSQPLPV